MKLNSRDFANRAIKEAKGVADVHVEDQDILIGGVFEQLASRILPLERPLDAWRHSLSWAFSRLRSGPPPGSFRDEQQGLGHSLESDRKQAYTEMFRCLSKGDVCVDRRLTL
jgi:hypothetical protein